MKTLLAVAVAAALSLGASAHATEFRVSGFGQIVAGALKDKDEYFPERQYTDEVSFREESLLGVQFDATFNDHFSGTAQVLARGDDREAELAWAYADVKLGKGFSTKVGRQRSPYYRYSDFLDVGQAYPWIRPPVAMYNMSWSNFDGISLSHSAFFGKWYSQAQVHYGRYEDRALFDGVQQDAKLDRQRGVTWDVEYDEWLSVRAAWLAADVTVDVRSLTPLIGVLNQFGMAPLASDIEIRDDAGQFRSLGVKVEKNGWLAVAEYAEISVEDSVFDNTDRHDWYTSLARRFGAVTPHVTYGRRSQGTNDEVLAGIPPQHPLYGALVYVSGSQRLDETFESVGVRWDVHDQVALKADWTRFESEIAGTPDAADLMSAGVVFTF